MFTHSSTTPSTPPLLETPSIKALNTVRHYGVQTQEQVTLPKLCRLQGRVVSIFGL